MPRPSIDQKLLTAAELAQATAGGVNYIRTKKNKVRGLAFKPTFNPHSPKAPGESGTIVFGTGKRRTGSAYLFLKSGAAVPTYAKRGTNAWEYFGDYRATKIRTDKATIKLHCGDDPVDNLAGVLYIEPAFGPEVEVSGGGYADTKTRKEIEAAAIAFATCDLVRQGFQVHDVQSENRGYDLLAVSPSDELLVEVKGADSLEPRFFLTRNERRFSSKQHKWRLFVVCNARTAPVLHQYTADEMLHQFTLDPLAWECTRNGSKIT